MKKNWTYGQKLGVGFSAMALLAIVMAVVALIALGNVVERKDRVIDHAGQDLIEAERLNATIQRKVASVRGYLFVLDEKYLRDLEAADAEFQATLEQIRTRTDDDAAADRIEAIATAYEDHAKATRSILKMSKAAQDAESIERAFESELVPRYEALRVKLRALVEAAERNRERGQNEATATAHSARSRLVATAIMTALMAAICGVLLTRVITNQVGTSVQHIRSSSAELQAAATQQASGAREQATAMSEISTTISELLATSRQIAESGKNVARMAADSAKSARTGHDAVERSRESVLSIKRQVDAIVEHMLTLGRKSQQIGGILEIINELSEQTNILAINATIEAAGAGDAGRRFSVVGEEIRKLSDRVGGSTKEIRALIDEIRTAVNSTVMATETGAKTVDAGTSRFEELQSAFSRIDEIVVSTMEAGQEIELSTKQQATAVEQVNVAISNVAQATKETEASSSQTLQTASQLTSLSDDLMRLVRTQSA